MTSILPVKYLKHSAMHVLRSTTLIIATFAQIAVQQSTQVPVASKFLLNFPKVDAWFVQEICRIINSSWSLSLQSGPCFS